MHYTFAASARSDLVDIWSHVAKDNPNAADRLIDSFYDRFSLLSQQPLMGESRSDLCERVCQFSVGAYVIFYIPAQNGIRVVRVLHGSPDIPAIFKQQGE